MAEQLKAAHSPIQVNALQWLLIMALLLTLAPLPACLLFGITFGGVLSYLYLIPWSIMQVESLPSMLRFIVGLPTGPILVWMALVCGLLIWAFRCARARNRLLPTFGGLVLLDGMGWLAVYAQYPE